MTPKTPLTILTGQNLAPSLVGKNLRQLADDIQASMDQRYVYSSFDLDFSTLSNTSASAEFTYTFALPYAYEIVGADLIAYEDTSPISSLTLTSTATGWENISVTPAGSTTIAQVTSNFVATVAANASTSFTLSVTTAGGAYTIESCYATIYVRFDRGNLGTSLTPYSPTVPASGGSVSSALINAQFTAVGAAVALDTAAAYSPRIEVYTWRNKNPPTANDGFRVPATSRKLYYQMAGALIAAASTVRFQLADASFTTNISIAGAGATVLATGTDSTTGTQSADAPTTTASDSTVIVTRTAGAANLVFGYHVILWR